MTAPDPRVDPRWPVVWHDDAGFYCRPESGGLLLCACDQVDVSPDALEVDLCVREDVAEKTGFSPQQLLKWTNMADLMRVSGVGEEYSELLEAAGVDTVKELRNRNPENLAQAMAAANAQKKLVRVVPSAKSVSKWIAQAKELPPAIRY